MRDAMLHLIPLCDYYFPFPLPHPSLQIPNTTLQLSDPFTIYYSLFMQICLEQAFGPVSVLIYDNIAGRVGAPGGPNRGFEKAFFIGESEVPIMGNATPLMGPTETRICCAWGLEWPW